MGAGPAELVGMILRESLVLTAPGLMVGVILALTFARLMKTFVYRVPPADPISLAAAAIFLIAVATVSAFVPARRAASVDPAVALRAE